MENFDVNFVGRVSFWHILLNASFLDHIRHSSTLFIYFQVGNLCRLILAPLSWRSQKLFHSKLCASNFFKLDHQHWMTYCCTSGWVLLCPLTFSFTTWWGKSCFTDFQMRSITCVPARFDMPLDKWGPVKSMESNAHGSRLLVLSHANEGYWPTHPGTLPQKHRNSHKIP